MDNGEKRGKGGAPAPRGADEEEVRRTVHRQK